MTEKGHNHTRPTGRELVTSVGNVGQTRGKLWDDGQAGDAQCFVAQGGVSRRGAGPSGWLPGDHGAWVGAQTGSGVRQERGRCSALAG